MTVTAHRAVYVEVVEETKALRQHVMVGRDSLRKGAVAEVAVALLEVAEVVVIRMVLFDDKNYVLEGRKVGGFHSDGGCRKGGCRSVARP